MGFLIRLLANTLAILAAAYLVPGIEVSGGLALLAAALVLGLINAVVPMAELHATANAWAQELLDKSPQTLRIAKLAFNAESDQSFWSGMFAGSELLSMHIDSEEFIEGPTAWLEKRKPNFRRFRKKLVRKT